MTEGKQIYYHRLRENSRKMSPRLKELAIEAGAYLDGGAILHGPMDVAKFAELIVKECLDQCYNRGMNDELYAGQLKAAEYIEEHFGIKE